MDRRPWCLCLRVQDGIVERYDMGKFQEYDDVVSDYGNPYNKDLYAQVRPLSPLATTRDHAHSCVCVAEGAHDADGRFP